MQLFYCKTSSQSSLRVKDPLHVGIPVFFFSFLKLCSAVCTLENQTPGAKKREHTKSAQGVNVVLLQTLGTLTLILQGAGILTRTGAIRSPPTQSRVDPLLWETCRIIVYQVLKRERGNA